MFTNNIFWYKYKYCLSESFQFIYITGGDMKTTPLSLKISILFNASSNISKSTEDSIFQWLKPKINFSFHGFNLDAREKAKKIR